MQTFPYLVDDEYADVDLADESYSLRNLHKYGREFYLNSCPDIIYMYLWVSQHASSGSKQYWAIIFGGPTKNQNAVQSSIIPSTIRRLLKAAPQRLLHIISTVPF